MTANWHDLTACALGDTIAAGTVDPRALTEHFLERIAAGHPDDHVYITVTAARARAEADAAGARARAGRRRHRLDGVPIAWKDLTDTAGIATTFASAILRERVPDRDALALRRAGLAGLVCLGKTNLSEFAYSGLGINPTFGTPANAADEAVARVPGGSSSGTGVAVAAGLAAAGIGSDTGGSVRIPAALNGLVGHKTSHGAIPLDGILPLSPSFDTLGPLTRSVADAAAISAVLMDRTDWDLAGSSLAGRRLLAPRTIVFDALDDTVAAAMDFALHRLRAAGAVIVEEPVPEFQAAFDLVARCGNMISAEGWALWRETLADRGGAMYPRIKERFDQALALSAIDEEEIRHGLRALSRRFHHRLAGFDAVIMPTCPRIAPPIAPLEADEAAYNEANLALTRNTRLGNLLETCGVTLPVRLEGALPSGLLVAMAAGRDGAVLRLAAAAEAAFAE